MHVIIIIIVTRDEEKIKTATTFQKTPPHYITCSYTPMHCCRCTLNNAALTCLNWVNVSIWYIIMYLRSFLTKVFPTHHQSSSSPLQLQWCWVRRGGDGLRRAGATNKTKLFYSRISYFLSLYTPYNICMHIFKKK